jgi:asparagine synthase (glutamine-hydrolysing)
VLTFQDGHACLRPYWELRYAGEYPVIDEAEFQEQLICHLRQAVRRQAANTPAGALLLSGGLDSRLLLGLLAEAQDGQPLVTFTWGIPGCDDARFAAEAARHVRARHYFFELKPDWLRGQAEQGVRQTDGLANLVNLHAFANLEAEVRHSQVVYKGFLGDAMFGFGLRPRFWADYNEADRLRTHLEAYRDYRVLSFDLPEHPRLFTDGFRARLGNSLLEDYALAADRANTPQLANQRLYVDLTQRVPRMTINGVEAVRSRMAVRLPFADNDLVEFTTRIPPGLQYDRRLIRRTFVETYPDLAKIPLTPSNLPLIACGREVALRGAQLARWHLRQRGLGRLAGPETRPYKDYNGWFRTVLRPWVEGTLLSPRALDRGYFQPSYVRQLVTDHMAGASHAVRLGGLLAVELWHQQNLD